uniref:Uncharacterized protein n=1 Tax=Oryza sativa subsp. japonica TaxID=39947 RepID=Q6Z4W4_ORYSJ|nr:hypothetical protein [Oryza sativa Japonica Group]BAC99734.1 hypothetical protein [Oryza sativa Japonica Group]
MQTGRITPLDPISGGFGLHGVRVAVQSAIYLLKNRWAPPVILLLHFSSLPSLSHFSSLSSLTLCLTRTAASGGRRAAAARRGGGGGGSSRCSSEARRRRRRRPVAGDEAASVGR